MIINVYWSSCEVNAFFVRFLMKFEFSWQIFEKYSDIICNKNLSSGSRVVLYGRTERRIDIKKLNNHFSQFDYAPKNKFSP